MRVVFQLDKERERVLTHSLQLYKRMIVEGLGDSAVQREIANYEVQLVNQLLTQLMTVKNVRTMLPTIASAPE